MVTTTDGQTRLDLLDVQKQHRARKWSDLLDEFYYRSTYSIPADFQMGRMDGFRSDGLSVGRITSDPMAGVRTKSHLARDPVDAYFVVLADRCPITLTQGGRVTRVEQKSFALISTTEPSSFHQAEPGAHANLVIPGHVMRQFATRIDDRVAIAFGRDPLHAMFYSLAAEWSRCAHDMIPASLTLVAKSIVDLLGLAIDGADQRSGESVIQQAHRHRIERIVRDTYADPALDLAFIAKRMGLSPRYVRSILAAQRTTANRLIKQRRIAEALRLCLSGISSRLTRRAIALAVGYVDLRRFDRDMEMLGGGHQPLLIEGHREGEEKDPSPSGHIARTR